VSDNNQQQSIKGAKMEPKYPWVTCYLTDILLSYVRESLQSETKIDYAALFRELEGFEIPSDPQSFLADARNWIPLSILRELELQCEKISGTKSIAYQAAKAYFTSGKKPLPSLFEVIVQVLNDMRSALIFANLWAAAQTNYLKLQSFEKQAKGSALELYMLAQFAQNAAPAIGAINLLRGFSEGFPRLYPFVEDIQCIEEISQLRLEDIVREFPDFALESAERRVTIRNRSSPQTLIEAVKVSLASERIPLSRDFLLSNADDVVLPRDDHIEVLTPIVEANLQGKTDASCAYQIVEPGALTAGPLSYALHTGQIYNAAYSRFRFKWKEKTKTQKQLSAENIRREISQLLFEHLKQIKQSHIGIIEFNIEKRKLALENLELRREIEREYSFSGIVGQSEKLRDLLSLVRSAAATDVTILIQGETGTGKELVARAIHYNSPRKAKRFVTLNCGALSETLLESELFGHEKGAFTGATVQRHGIFEVADGGTLFLDEIGEISPSTQVKLLRVLQEGELQRVGGAKTIKVDVRIVAATNQNLADLMNNGRVRQDLFYRLNVFPITVPPLRERLEDIPILVNHFIEKRKETTKRDIKGITPQAMALLMAHRWPGNVRELENTIQRAMVIAKGEILDVGDLPPEIRGNVTASRAQPTDLKEIARESSEIVEKRTIVGALSKTGGNVTQAAKALGISRATLQNKMKLYELRHPKKPADSG
jgi:transcriptional regulator with PAS, ATPase and Fis domain